MLYWFRKWEQECNYKLFSQTERKTMFCEILAEGLLRGKTLTRYQAYNIGRNAGFLSANDIRRLENMNSIGEKGDIYLEPLNMKPAGTETPPRGNEGFMRKAHRDLIFSQLLRVIRKDFKTFEARRNFAKTILYEPVNAYASTLIGMEVRTKLNNTIDELIDSNLSEKDAEQLADRIIEIIGGNHNAITKTKKK
jgi:hypothetical protein